MCGEYEIWQEVIIKYSLISIFLYIKEAKQREHIAIDNIRELNSKQLCEDLNLFKNTVAG